VARLTGNRARGEEIEQHKHKHIMYKPYNCSPSRQVQKTSIGPKEGLRRTMDFSSAPRGGGGSLFREIEQHGKIESGVRKHWEIERGS
jgi:hypothetical protein